MAAASKKFFGTLVALALVVAAALFFRGDPSETAPRPEAGPASEPPPSAEPELPLKDLPSTGRIASIEPLTEQGARAAAAGSLTEPTTGTEIVLLGEELDLSADADHSHKLREWLVLFDPPLKEVAQKSREHGFRLTLPNGESIEIVATSYEQFSGDAGVLMGHQKGNPLNEIVLSHVRDAVGGAVRGFDSGHVWSFRSAGGGLQYLAEIDSSAMGECANCVELKDSVN